MLASSNSADVIVLGAGPAGSSASAVLARRGRKVLCVERSYFPRHSIGESLLPRSNVLLAEAGLLEAVEARGYQKKGGATFVRGAERERFCFGDGLPGEPPYTFQVPRADFDLTLALGARAAGADVRYGLEVTRVEVGAEGSVVGLRDLETGEESEARARFVIDASGAGRVLPRLLGLERPATLGERGAIFSMFEGDRRPSGEEAGDIWVCVDEARQAWFWVIPFSDGRTSVGVVADKQLIDGMGANDRERLAALIEGEPNARERLKAAVPVMRTGRLAGWSTSVERLSGPGFALAGNAGEFLDPVFSSGVTVALESGVLAAKLADRQLAGEGVDWAADYDAVVRRAVAVFKAFVEGWYRGEVPKIFFARYKVESVKRQITSILAGHVLKAENPLVRSTEPNLRRLSKAVEMSAGAGDPGLGLASPRSRGCAFLRFLMRSRWWLVWLALSAVACKDPAEPVDNERVPAKTAQQPAAQAGQAQQQPAQANQAQANQAQAAGRKGKASAITFEGPIAWKSWDEGLKQAQATKRPIMLLVYADWCPHCRELKPVFADPEIAKLSEKLVMVKQDADEDPAWLGPKIGHLGSYVPRLFFLKPDGTVQADITSGNARFPYFYTPEGIEALKSSMRRAAGG